MSDTNIAPADIDASKPLYSAFGAHEAEVAARWIVEFCQYRNSWKPFTYAEIQDFYATHGMQDVDDPFRFCCLIDRCDVDVYHLMSAPTSKLPWIETGIQDGEVMYTITPEFVARCYEHFPNNPE